MIDERRRTSFDDRAEAYDAARPGYPDALVADVVARTGARTVVEVGAGTGQATVAFAGRGCSVLALEPGPRLAAFLRRRTAELPGIRVQSETFETWTPGDARFDLVLAAQSFHWVDPGVRYAKAARVARHLAVVRNEVGPIDSALREDFDRAYSRWTGGDGNACPRHAVETARRTWVEEIDRSGLYGVVHVRTFPWEAAYSAKEYLALLATYSDHAVLDEPVRRGLHGQIADAIDRRGGRIVVPYVALAFVATAR